MAAGGLKLVAGVALKQDLQQVRREPPSWESSLPSRFCRGTWAAVPPTFRIPNPSSSFPAAIARVRHSRLEPHGHDSNRHPPPGLDCNFVASINRAAKKLNEFLRRAIKI